MSDSVITVEQIGKSFRKHCKPYGRLTEDIKDFFTPSNWRLKKKQPDDEFWALRDVSLSMKEGEVFGLIGRNGAGKSTLLKIISRITRPSEGRIIVKGQVGSLLEVGTGFHPELTGRENIFLNGAIIGMSKSDIKRSFDEIVAFSGVEPFIDMQIKHYSSGMQTRLAFSIAAHLKTDILILDEVLSVGDFAFQKKCLEKMRELSQSDRTIVFVSHNMSTVMSTCDRCGLLAEGRLIDVGEPRVIVPQYQALGGSDQQEYSSAEKGVRVADFAFETSSGHALEAINNGEPAKLRFTFETLYPLSGVCFLVAINDVNLRRITALDSRLKQQTFNFEPGKYTLSVNINDIPMIAGEYNTTLKIDSAAGALLSVESGPRFMVEVGEKFSDRHFHQDDWHGIICLEQDWSVAAL